MTDFPGTHTSETFIIDWVNSLDIPSCALVDCADDLLSGAVVADITAWMKGSSSLKGIERLMVNESEAFNNWTIILNELSSVLPPSLKSISPSTILSSKQALLAFVDFLSKTNLEKVSYPPVQMSPSTMHRKHSPSVTSIPQANSASYREIQTIAPTPTRLHVKTPEPTQNGNHDKPAARRERNHEEDLPMELPRQVPYEAKPVPEAMKEKLIAWLEETGVVKKGSLNSAVLPELCRAGVILGDLINRLEGRNEVLRGIQRHPKNNTAALTNINKALEFLRQFPKMNPRYLWSGQNILRGDENVIWGILEDLSVFYAKPSANLPPILPITNQPPTPTKPTVPLTPSKMILKPALRSESPVREQTPKPKLTDLSLPHAFLANKSKVLRSYAQSARRRTPTPRSPLRSKQSSTFTKEEEPIFITIQAKKEVNDWISALDLEDYIDDKTGYLLGEIVNLISGGKLSLITARNESSIRRNYIRALEVLREIGANLPGYMYRMDERLASGDIELQYSLLYLLMSLYPNLLPLPYQPNDLPYKAAQIKKLEESVLVWLTQIDILTSPPKSILELLPDIKSGCLLCILAERMLNLHLGWCRIPQTDPAAAQNIRKALNAFRKLPRMSQKFLWGEKEILKGRVCFILGLLEDLHRWNDGLAARRPGKDYHYDGPYLGQTPEKYMLHPLMTEKQRESSYKQIRINNQHSILSGVTISPGSPSSKSMFGNDIVEWLENLGVPLPTGFSLEDKQIKSFSTGELLCDIVSVLTKEKVQGVYRKPKTHAAALQNARKALARLEPYLKRDLAELDSQIIEGNPSVIKELLKEMRRIFTFKKVPSRTRISSIDTNGSSSSLRNL
jgi:hypothetical protein